MENHEEYDNRRLHTEARDATGFWGRQAAGCLVFAQETGRWLIAHRSLEVLEPGTWGTWGGAIDANERPLDAVVRELQEESGLHAGAILEAVPSFVFRHASGFQYHNFLVVVAQEYEPQLDDETQGFRWCTMDDLPDDLHPGLQSLLASPLAQQQMAALAAGSAPLARIDVDRLGRVEALVEEPAAVGGECIPRL